MYLVNEKNKTYTVTLADGTKLENLKPNGNMFLSSQEIEESVFKDNCNPVIISDGETEEQHAHMALGYIDETPNGGYVFYLRDLTPYELFQIKTAADIEYLAMMSDIEL